VPNETRVIVVHHHCCCHSSLLCVWLYRSFKRNGWEVRGGSASAIRTGHSKNYPRVFDFGLMNRRHDTVDFSQKLMPFVVSFTPVTSLFTRPHVYQKTSCFGLRVDDTYVLCANTLQDLVLRYCYPLTAEHKGNQYKYCRLSTWELDAQDPTAKYQNANMIRKRNRVQVLQSPVSSTSIRSVVSYLSRKSDYCLLMRVAVQTGLL
jgi:hypothetical protein